MASPAGRDEELLEEEEEILLTPRQPPKGAAPPAEQLSGPRGGAKTPNGTADAVIDELQSLSLSRSSLDGSPAVTVSRTLLILDLNGLLCDRLFYKDSKSASPPPGGTRVGSFSIYTRPHADSFIEFVIEHFDVAIWSSAKVANITPILDRVIPKKETRQLIKFVWGQDQCRQEASPLTSPKPLFLKPLARVWEKFPQYEHHTLLIDDSAVKARDNPPYSAIHPEEWTLEATDDQGLAPGSYLRTYLDDLRHSQLPVPSFVKARPFAPTSL